MNYVCNVIITTKRKEVLLTYVAWNQKRIRGSGFVEAETFGNVEANF